MPEHVCEWRKWHPWCAVYRCVYPRCYKNMSSDEVERRLNVTGRLSADMADDMCVVGHVVTEEEADACAAYANTLEGKDA